MENENSMTPARKQTRFIGYPSKNLVPILTELPRLIGQFLMSSSTASFGIIYNYFGNSITIRSIDKVSLNKRRVQKLETNKQLQKARESWKSSNKVEQFTKYEKWPHLLAIGDSN